MRSSLLACVPLLLFALPAHAGTPASAFHRKRQAVGSRWLGADLVRSVRATHDGSRAGVELVTEARLRVATGAFTAFRIREQSVGSNLRARPLLRRGTRLELLGGTNFITITANLFKRSLKVKSFTLPVFAVGPIPVTLEADVGAYLELNRTGAFDWPDGPSVTTGFSGVARLGGTVELGPGFSKFAKAGIHGEVNLLQASLPATVTLHLDAVSFDVKFVLSSNAHVKLFARLGIGWFSREFALTLPFLDWTFFKREVPIAHRTIRFE